LWDIHISKSPTIVRTVKSRRAGHVSKIGRQGMHDGKWLLARPKRWQNSITMDFNKAGCKDERWMELAQDHVQWWVGFGVGSTERSEC